MGIFTNPMAKNIKYHPEVAKEEHDDTQLPPTKRVSLYGWDADTLSKVRLATDALGSLESSGALQFLPDSVVSTTYYFGTSEVGTATSAAIWQIMKVETASGVKVTFAGGDSKYDNIYDDREGLSYS